MMNKFGTNKATKAPPPPLPKKIQICLNLIIGVAWLLPYFFFGYLADHHERARCGASCATTPTPY